MFASHLASFVSLLGPAPIAKPGVCFAISQNRRCVVIFDRDDIQAGHSEPGLEEFRIIARICFTYSIPNQRGPEALGAMV